MRELADQIRAFTEGHNDAAKPFVWAATAQSILEKWAGFLGFGSSQSHASQSLNATYFITNHREDDASASHYPSSCTLPPIENDPLVQCGTANIPDNRGSIFCRRTSCETNG